MTFFTKPTEPKPHQRRCQQRRSEHGFTLIELMVALAIGAIAITSVYAVGAASTQQFREQQRVSSLQTSLRMAMNQLKRDIGRIGYYATPNANLPGETCMPTKPVIPITLTENGEFTLVDTDDFEDSVLHADSMSLVGNYATRSDYKLAGLADINATDQGAYLQTEWQAFRRDFVNQSSWEIEQPYSPEILNVAAFQSVFRPKRWLRLENQDGFKFFVTIKGVNLNDPKPQVVFGNPTLPLSSPCVGATMSEGKVAPLSMIRYRLFDGTNDPAGTSQDNPTLNGDNIQLVREEVEPDDGNALLSAGDANLQNSSRRVLLEYVVNFNISAVMDSSDGDATQEPCLWMYDNGGNMSGAGRCGQAGSGINFNNITNQLRTLIVDVSVRTPEPDMNFPWPGGTIDQLPITRYRPKNYITNNRSNAFRVRSLRAEILVPSVAYE